MSRFGPDPLAFFDAVYDETPPWEIGGPQPALAALLAEHPPADPIVDVGCGSGDLSIALAQEGRRVIGVDFVPAAIERAREKAARLPPAVGRRLEFHVGDAREPSRFGPPFGAVIDSGFLHLFDAEDADRFVAELSRTLRPGGRYYLLEFAVTFPIPNAPRAIGADEVRERFTAERGWRILSCRPAEFLNRVAPVASTCACVERVAGGA
jgi:SAM-dependent methyltransferase